MSKKVRFSKGVVTRVQTKLEELFRYPLHSLQIMSFTNSSNDKHRYFMNIILEHACVPHAGLRFVEMVAYFLSSHKDELIYRIDLVGYCIDSGDLKTLREVFTKTSMQKGFDLEGIVQLIESLEPPKVKPLPHPRLP